MKKILAIILILSISLTFLMVAIEINSYNKNYYLNSYIKHDIERVTGRNLNDLNAITDDLIDYLKAKGGDELLKHHFNEREILHMHDVQALFDYARLVKYIFGLISIALLAYLGNNKEFIILGRTLTFGLFINHIFLLIMGLLVVSNFNKYFTIFHHIFFTNDLWILDPKTDLMIQMLPEEFFYGMAIRIGLSFFMFLSILQLAGLYYIKKGKGNGEKIRIL